MTLASFDASALVKLVIDEHGSGDVAMVWDGADAVVTSRVAHPEYLAALAAAHRDRRLGDTDHDAAKRDWASFNEALRILELTEELEDAAGRLAEAHALNGFDTIHLASALTLADGPLIVATWGGRLLRAARTFGLGTIPTGT